MQQHMDLDAVMATSSIAGATATQLLNQSSDSTRRKVAEGVAGAMIGIFCGPAVAGWAGANEDHGKVAICFLIGAVGIFALTKSLDWFKTRFDLEAWLPWIGGKK